MVYPNREKEIPFDGLVLFPTVEQAIKTEKILKEAGYIFKLVAPPPQLRRGCDLAIEINLVEQIGIERLLEQKEVAYTEVVPLEGGEELLNIVKVADFGSAIMVKAGNMKVTFDKSTGIILNTSGGGCPDIPYLHAELVGRKLIEAPRPKEIGFTLCAVMMDRALIECQQLWNELR